MSQNMARKYARRKARERAKTGPVKPVTGEMLSFVMPGLEEMAADILAGRMAASHGGFRTARDVALHLLREWNKGRTSLAITSRIDRLMDEAADLCRPFRLTQKFFDLIEGMGRSQDGTGPPLGPCPGRPQGPEAPGAFPGGMRTDGPAADPSPVARTWRAEGMGTKFEKLAMLAETVEDMVAAGHDPGSGR